VLDEIYQLFIDLDAGDHHIDFEIISASPVRHSPIRGIGMPCERCRPGAAARTIIEAIPAPSGNPRWAPAKWSPSSTPATTLGRLSIGRVVNGVMRRARTVALL
jgi:GTP-binding protein